jgi:hypothetical protein
MSGLKREKAAGVAKYILRVTNLGRGRADGERMTQQSLKVRVHGLQISHVLRRLNRRRIFVAGFVGHLQIHQVPTLRLISPEWVK